MSVSTVSATGIQDPTGQVFANGTWQLYFTPTYATPGPFTDGGVVFTRIYSGTLDATGSFSQAGVNRNDTISPAGSRWKLIVTPAAPSASTEILINVNAPAVDVTAAINALIQPIQVSAQGLPRAYKDAELNNPDGNGALYYDETLKQLKVWDAILGIWIATPVNGSSPTFNIVTATGGFLANDGSAAAPSHSFINNTDRGFYNDVAQSSIGITIAGVERAIVSSGGFAVKSGSINLAAGTFGMAASNGFGAIDTGVSRSSPNSVAIGNGTLADASGNLLAGNAKIVGPGVTGIGAIVATLVSGGTSATSGGIQVYKGVSGVNATELFRADASNGNVMASILQLPSLTAGIFNAPDTSLSRAGVATVAVGNGTQGDTSGSLKAAHILAGDGTPSAPSYSFSADTGTGFWRASLGSIFLASNNIDQILFTANVTRSGSGMIVGFSANSDPGVAPSDTNINRGAAGILQIGTGETSNAFGTLAAAFIKTGAGTSLAVPATGANVVSDTATQTVSNKRITKRAVAQADATSITVNSDTTDIATQVNTQVAGTLTLNAPTGTPTDGQPLLIRIKSTNAQTYSFNAAFRFSTTTVAPTGITAGKVDLLAFVWNATDSKWDVAGVNQGH